METRYKKMKNIPIMDAKPHKKWLEVLNPLDRVCQEKRKENYVEQLIHHVDTSSSYLRMSLHRLEKLGLVKKEKIKKRVYWEPTLKGKETIVNMQKMKTMINE